MTCNFIEAHWWLDVYFPHTNLYTVWSCYGNYAWAMTVIQHEVNNAFAQVHVHIMCTSWYVTVPGRNQTLFHCAFRPRYRVHSAVAQYFHQGQGPYVLQRFEHDNTVEICNGITFDFYPRLTHIIIDSVMIASWCYSQSTRRPQNLFDLCNHVTSSILAILAKVASPAQM